MPRRRASRAETRLAKKTQAINLDLHKQQLREIDTQFGALLKNIQDTFGKGCVLFNAPIGQGPQVEAG